MKRNYVISSIIILTMVVAIPASAAGSGEYIKQGAYNEVGRIATQTAVSIVHNVFYGVGLPKSRSYGYGYYGVDNYGDPYENAYYQELEVTEA